MNWVPDSVVDVVEATIRIFEEAIDDGFICPDVEEDDGEHEMKRQRQ